MGWNGTVQMQRTFEDLPVKLPDHRMASQKLKHNIKDNVQMPNISWHGMLLTNGHACNHELYGRSCTLERYDITHCVQVPQANLNFISLKLLHIRWEYGQL